MLLSMTVTGECWKIRKKGEWTVEQVKEPPISDDFHANDSKVNGVDYRTHFFWLRYRLKNTLNKAVEVVLLNTTQADQTDFFVLDEA